ncbi:MAG: glycoside hydrolase family 15 protein [Rhodothermales bacterium]
MQSTPTRRDPSSSDPAYQPIEDYGLIGDMHTAALVSMHGSIDWCCMPRFDAPSVFARLLDHEKGGYWQIRAASENVACKQFYWPDTNILITRFLSAEGVGEVTDYMPVGSSEESRKRRRIVRTVKAVRGTVQFSMECTPAFDYARETHELKVTEQGACFIGTNLHLGLASEVRLEANGSGVACSFSLEEGESTTFILREIGESTDCGQLLSEAQAESVFQDTVHFWRTWLSQCTYTGRWRETVERSALALKLLTYDPTGAIVAAPTCSLPEEIGGGRNWDYRYTWIRDAAFTLYAFLRIGFDEEAAAFMEYLAGLCERETKERSPLQIMYGIDGRRELTEESLDHLEGYRESRPVRIGNGAYDQLQLDIYGELLDAVYLYNKHGARISYDLWLSVRRFVNWVCDNWQRQDEGVWEIRGGRQHFVYSKLMCWVAVDRGLRLAEKRSFPADRQRWITVRDEIYETIMSRGWNEELQSFVQTLDGEALDASNLIMPLVFFVSPVDPRMLGTLEATRRSPDDGGLVANGLVYRYNLQESNDGLQGDEGTFNICTFWLVEAMTRAGRTKPEWLEQARLTFEQMLGYANHVGLYAEETGHHGEALGNFPQAFTHLSLISAAYNLDRTLGTPK